MYDKRIAKKSSNRGKKKEGRRVSLLINSSIINIEENDLFLYHSDRI